MKKTGKKLLFAALTLGLMAAALISLSQPKPAAAATTKHITLYKGETVESFTSLKSIKSANKKIVKAYGKKNNYGSKDYFMTAKKTGKTTVTLKTKYRGAIKYAVTVKKAKFKTSIRQMTANTYMLAVNNKAGQTFDRIEVKYSLKDASGNVLKEETEPLSYVLKGKTAYTTLFFGQSNGTVDLAQSSAKVTALTHNPEKAYKDISKKIKVKSSVSEGASGKTISLTMKNKTKESYPSGRVYVTYYDEGGELLGFDYTGLSLDAKGTNTRTFTVSNYSYPNFADYKIAVQAYYTK